MDEENWSESGSDGTDDDNLVYEVEEPDISLDDDSEPD